MLVITLLTRRNNDLTQIVLQMKKDAVQTPASLSYTLGTTPASVSTSVSAFSFSPSSLKSLGVGCGTEQSAEHYAQIVNAFSGAQKTTYTFSYTEPTQDSGRYYVTVVPNAPGYATLAEFQNDFNICEPGGDMYPVSLTSDWLIFDSACGTGYDDGSGLPHGCDVMRTAIEPTLQMP